MAHKRRLGDVLIDACLISTDQLDEALRLQHNQRKLLGQILVDMGWVGEHDVCRAVAELLNIKFVDVKDALISQDVVQLTPEELAARSNILPLFIQDKTLYLAMENPLDIDIIQRIEFRTGLQVRPMIAPPSQLRETIRKHYNVDEYIGTMLGHVKESSVRVEMEEDDSDEAVDVSEAKRLSEGSHIVKLANLIISEGIKRRASDIHIEPTAKGVLVRYRIDGLLMKGLHVPNWIQLPLISRLKVLAGMDIAEHRKPQDGRIRVTHHQRKIDLRVSTLLTNFGEKMVIRILDSKAAAHNLERLGFSSEQLAIYQGLIRQPQGWILVTGPTGSGKTTTLYASLNAIKDETKNIVTVEDPIEYQMEGINQVQVNPKAGLTFASGLRSILRQDPNVILVGEIRDAETATIAMQSAETGHLVLSTLHTNDAISTVNRLFNLGISSDLVASNLLVVIAQRLVRRICPKCKAAYTPTAAEWQSIGVYDGSTAPFAVYKGNGCAACKQTGYYGQIGLYELFIPTARLQDEIAKRPTLHALKQLAAEDGMKTLLDDGLEKIRQGLTTIEEVVRVCAIKLDEAAKTTPADSIILPQEAQAAPCETCERCGAHLDQAWFFCPMCGTPKSGMIAPDHLLAPHLIASPDSTAIPKQSIRIVTADDDASIREIVKILLESQGYQVIPAIDGADALEKIRAELPDLAILDVAMPQRDGFSVCQAVRSSVETMFIPVMMLTGQDSTEEKLRGLSLGADDYITKPFNADELLARVEAVLRRTYRKPVMNN